jgi:hypothetical protein
VTHKMPEFTWAVRGVLRAVVIVLSLVSLEAGAGFGSKEGVRSTLEDEDATAATDRIAQLKRDMEAAVVREDYDAAADLKDKLRKLPQSRGDSGCPPVKAFVLSMNASSPRFLQTAAVLRSCSVPFERIQPVPLDDPLLALVKNCGHGINIEKCLVESNARTQIKVWERIADDTTMCEGQWGMVVEDDLGLSPGVAAEDIPQVFREAKALSVDTGFFYGGVWGVCRPPAVPVPCPGHQSCMMYVSHVSHPPVPVHVPPSCALVELVHTVAVRLLRTRAPLARLSALSTFAALSFPASPSATPPPRHLQRGHRTPPSGREHAAACEGASGLLPHARQLRPRLRNVQAARSNVSRVHGERKRLWWRRSCVSQIAWQGYHDGVDQRGRLLR